MQRNATAIVDGKFVDDHCDPRMGSEFITGFKSPQPPKLDTTQSSQQEASAATVAQQQQ